MTTADDRRSRLLECAVRRFAREGMDAANTSAVAKDAGVAAGTLFNYFHSKTELIRSAYLFCKTSAADAMRASIRESATPRESLAGIWRAALAWHLEHPDATDFMEQFRNSPAANDESVMAHVESEFAFLCDLVTAAQTSGEIVDLPLEYLDRVFTALFLATVGHIRENKLAPDDPFQAASFELLWRAIARSGP